MIIMWAALSGNKLKVLVAHLSDLVDPTVIVTIVCHPLVGLI
jgi:hypothetical protein